MANYSEHADCYPSGHQRGGPCGPGCPYSDESRRRRGQTLPKDVPVTVSAGKHKGSYKEETVQ